MRMREKRKWLFALACLCLLLTLMALPRFSAAQDQQDQDDPPNRAARLGYMEGSVSFEPAGESDWVQAVSNRPMTTGDKLWADKDSRASIGLGSATFYLSSNTGVTFLNLDDNTVQLELSAGTVDVIVRELPEGNDFEVDTANQAFAILQPGRYRLYSDENGDTTMVTVREGQGQSTGNGQTYTINAGQQVTFTGTTQLNAQMTQIGQPDDFDNWAYGRDRRYEDSQSARYCSHDMVGYEDLDQYGDWQSYPEYGEVWYPHVDAGWAPYHEGHWAWIDPWGWTWVDSDPWGYAPFHYGRWANISGRWGWVPGPVAMAPVFAPALVVFVGGNGIAFGNNVAWFPLGPREVYIPPYRVGPQYVNRINITNTTVNQTTITNVYNTTIVRNNTTITNVNYMNRNVNGAVTAVPQRAFVSAKPVAQAAVRVNPRQLAAVPVSARVAVTPTASAVLGVHANTAGHVTAPPRAVVTRPVVARVAPPPAPVPFAARQKELASHPGQPIPRPQLRQMAAAHPPAQPERVHVAPPGKPATPVAAHPANSPAENRPGNRPANERPAAPAERPGAQPNQPENRNQPQPGSRSFAPPAGTPEPNRTQPNRPEPNHNAPENRPENRAQPPARNEHPPAEQPNYRSPESNRPPAAARPEQPPARNERPAPAPRPEERPAPNNRPENPPRNAQPPRNEAPRNQPPRNESPRSAPQPERNAHPEQSRPAPQRAEPARPPQRQDRPPEKPKQEEQRPPGK